MRENWRDTFLDKLFINLNYVPLIKTPKVQVLDVVERRKLNNYGLRPSRVYKQAEAKTTFVWER